MNQRLLYLLALILLAFLAGLHVGQKKPAVVYANASSSIPLSFGTCRGAMGNELLIFEDIQGTVRLVQPASGMLFGTVSRK